MSWVPDRKKGENNQLLCEKQLKESQPPVLVVNLAELKKMMIHRQKIEALYIFRGRTRFCGKIDMRMAFGSEKSVQFLIFLRLKTIGNFKNSYIR